MERLARAQVRKAGGADEGAVEEIKRIELDTAWGEVRSGNTGWGDERGTASRPGASRRHRPLQSQDLSSSCSWSRV